MNPSANDDLVALIKRISETEKVCPNKANSIALTKQAYDSLIKQLWEADIFLQSKYPDYQLVPQIYTLFGVKIEIL
jgi:hypothetical protein